MDIDKLLIELLADQYGVVITEVKKNEKEVSH